MNSKKRQERRKKEFERKLVERCAESVDLPSYISNAIKDGMITQWRKFPRFFFVNGVSGGRIVLDEKTGSIAHRHLSKVPKDEYPIFRDVFNELNQKAREHLAAS